LTVIANPSVNPSASQPYIKRTSSTLVNLPDVYGRTFNEQGKITLTVLGPEIIVPNENVGLNVSIQIPWFLLQEWTVIGAGIAFSPDNAIEHSAFSFDGTGNGFTRPSLIRAYFVNSSSPFERIWAGYDLVQFTSEGAIGGTAELTWLPNSHYWQNANLNNTDIKLRATTSIQVEPTTTLHSQEQTIFNNRLTLSNEYLTTFLVLTGIWVSTFVAGSYEAKGKRRRKFKTTEQGVATVGHDAQLTKKE
jgi:hypothetical protein